MATRPKWLEINGFWPKSKKNPAPSVLGGHVRPFLVNKSKKGPVSHSEKSQTPPRVVGSDAPLSNGMVWKTDPKELFASPNSPQKKPNTGRLNQPLEVLGVPCPVRHNPPRGHTCKIKGRKMGLFWASGVVHARVPWRMPKSGQMPTFGHNSYPPTPHPVIEAGCLAACVLQSCCGHANQTQLPVQGIF